ncbi:MAG TPA: hypothetical protein VMG38_06700 [Trebonia sp.]|nr:hypothetical protein [Trebonia sp.]
MGRNRRGSRHVSTKARIGIAAAVLLGGGAIGTVAVATNDLSSITSAQSSGYTVNFQHRVSVPTALTTALNDWSWSQQRSMSTLASMAPMKSFVTVRRGHTTLAAQRGVVVLATKHFLLVKSVNGSLHLWLVNGATRVKNVAGSTTGMTALTGSSSAAKTAVTTGNLTPAGQTMAGGSTVTAMNNPATKPTTVTVAVAGTGETITITPSTATVMPSTQTAAQQSGTSMTGTTQPTFAMTNHVARGDLVLVAGTEQHGELRAQLVLFAAPAKTPTPTPSATATATVPATTPTPTVPVATPSASQTQSGVHF